MKRTKTLRRGVAAVVLTAVVLVAAGWGALVWVRRDTRVEQAERLAAAMGWRAGYRIAEIGAGDGSMSLLAARRVGPNGRVYANEIDPAMVAALRLRAARGGNSNLTAVEGSGTSANLPESCCEAVFMRWVYHHFTNPAAMNASLFHSLRPGGLLAIADFSPTFLRRIAALLKRHPVDGMPAAIIVRQVTEAGFVSQGEIEAWPGRGYCLLFRKPVTQ